MHRSSYKASNQACCEPSSYITMSSERSSHSSSKEQQRARAAEPSPGPAGRKNNSKASGRILSACDTCRQSKVRCTGGNPCLTCQWYQRSCNYSPAGRLGRPKGSKNRRTLMQQILSLNKEQPSATQGDTNRSGEDSMHWVESGRQQQQRQQQLPRSEPELIEFEFDIGETFDPTIALGDHEALIGNGRHDFMLDTCYDLSAEDDMNLSERARFAQGSAADPPNLQSLGVDDPFAFISPFLAQTLPEPAGKQQLPVSQSGMGQSDAFPSDEAVDSFSDLCFSNNPAPSASSRASPFSSASRASTPSNMPSNVYSDCSCLQRLVRLLYHLEELRFTQGRGDSHATRDHKATGPSADSVLRAVQAAKTPWQSFIQCSVPSGDKSHREALLLFAMSIRTLLLAVQMLNSTIGVNQNEASSDIAVSIGDFVLNGEVKAEIIGVVVRRALWTIAVALQHLWERTGQPNSQAGSESSNSSPERCSPISILAYSLSKEPPYGRPRDISIPAVKASFGAAQENVASLLTTLQCTMKALENET